MYLKTYYPQLTYDHTISEHQWVLDGMETGKNAKRKSKTRVPSFAGGEMGVKIPLNTSENAPKRSLSHHRIHCM